MLDLCIKDFILETFEEFLPIFTAFQKVVFVMIYDKIRKLFSYLIIYICFL